MVLCYELISMMTERNNLHEVDTWMFFKYFVKMWVAVYLVSNTFNIVMAVFDIGQSVVSSAAGYITGRAAIDVSGMIATMETAMESMGIPELMMLSIETALVSLCMKLISILIMVILYGRMIEIYYIPGCTVRLPPCQQRGGRLNQLFQRAASHSRILDDGAWVLWVLVSP